MFWNKSHLQEEWSKLPKSISDILEERLKREHLSSGYHAENGGVENEGVTTATNLSQSRATCCIS